jgi:predicted urease superfamily metal-dependent hydrolase
VTISKQDPSKVNESIMNEIQSLWNAYNEMKQQTQKLNRQIGASLFFHLYKKQLKRYEWIRRSRAEIITEGEIVVKKKDKDTELLNRHFFFIF